MSNNTTVVLFNDTLPLDNSTNSTNVTEAGFNRFVDTIYYEIDAVRDSQMIMGTMFLGMVLGMIIMVLCCVKHKSDGYYRVPPPKSVEEVELVQANRHNGRLPGEARFVIGLGDDDD